VPDDTATTSQSWQRIKDLVELASKIATVALAIIAFYATQEYNRQQDLERSAREREQKEDQKQQTALHQIQTIMGLFDPLASADTKKHHLAVITVKELTANIPLALKLCLAAASQKECATTASAFATDTLLALSRDTSQNATQLKRTAVVALDYQQAKPDSSVGRSLVLSTATRPSNDSQAAPRPLQAGAKSGWVFLGSYGDSSWSTRYLDFPVHAVPASLSGKSLQVRHETGSLNVRANLFYEPGYDRIVDVLAPGSTVTLDSVSSYAGAGYFIWAQVRYRVGSR